MSFELVLSLNEVFGPKMTILEGFAHLASFDHASGMFKSSTLLEILSRMYQPDINWKQLAFTSTSVS